MFYWVSDRYDPERRKVLNAGNSGLFCPVWGWNQIMSGDYWTRKSFRNNLQSETCDSNTRGILKSFVRYWGHVGCFLYHLLESRHLLSLVIWRYLIFVFKVSLCFWLTPCTTFYVYVKKSCTFILYNINVMVKLGYLVRLLILFCTNWTYINILFIKVDNFK